MNVGSEEISDTILTKISKIFFKIKENKWPGKIRISIEDIIYGGEVFLNAPFKE